MIERLICKEKHMLGTKLSGSQGHKHAVAKLKAWVHWSSKFLRLHLLRKEPTYGEWNTDHCIITAKLDVM